VEIAEPEGDRAVQIIESKIGYFEGRYRVYFSYNAIEEVIALSRRYIHNKYLPDKAIKILEQVAVKVSKERGASAVVTSEDIAEVVSRETKIPVTKIGREEGQSLLHLEERIHERMIDQEEAVKMVSAALRRARTQLREGKRPIASFLFLGPTGVGKTELAKALSAVYFGSEDYMARVDMSEYQNQDSVNKMIGSADGAQGYLTEAVRRQPFTLVLLDEVEKAHPDILNLFLQVMDDGRLTDGQGRTIDFTNAIIIATSNIGAVFIQQEILKGRPPDEIKNAIVNEYLVKVMRPELINRFDGIVVFEPLSIEHVVEIARLMLDKIAKMLEGKGIALRAEEPGVRLLAAQGFDPKFGARPLRRLLQDKVEDKIANFILAGDLNRRDTVVIDEQAEVAVEKGVNILE
jgi:ATP-dependent Clp protease ATP-binding subunit ClpA